MAQLAVMFTTPMGLLQLGLMAASTVGSFLMPGNKEKQSNKLSDLKVSTSAYGQGIPLMWGTDRAAGNMFWASDFEEVKKSGGKGGKGGKGGGK